jgi:NifU-like protein involved in Fe-S cluster formation
MTDDFAADFADLYSPQVWRLFETAPGAGRFGPEVTGVVVGEGHSRASTSALRLEFRVEAGKVADARFQAYGCPTSIAVGAWIAGWSRDRTPAEIVALRAARLRSELEIADDRAHCALLGEDAVRAAFPEFQSDHRSSAS